MLTILLAVLLATGLESQPAQSGLRIVVLEGEDAVNVIQQKTAVRPLIEVRDRNNLPVAGATVTFTIGAGQPAAFAGGAQTLTVTTNAAGQAAASGLNALGSGAVQIQVQSAYQGQIATAAISQTNVATAAAASQAGTAASSASGGGLSTGATLGIVGGVVAAGGIAVGAAQLARGASDEAADEARAFEPFEGTVSGPLIYTYTGGANCTVTSALGGSLRINLRTNLSGGAVTLNGSITPVSSTGSCMSSTSGISVQDLEASGGPSALTFISNRTVTTANEVVTERVSFTGSHSNNTITGSLAIEISMRFTSASGGSANASTTVPVTLVRTAGR